MDFKPIIRRSLPALAAFALFFIVSALYFAPQFRGEVLPQHDVMQYEGMTREILDTRAATGEDPQWTGAMFGGMPAYMINVAYPAQWVKLTAGRAVKALDTPAGFLFFAMAGFWLMLLMMGVNPWVGIVPALAYGLSTYFLLIIGAGHVTKMWALVYAPPMMGGAWMALRGRMWAGAAITALAASLEIGANHPQITYYFLLAMAAFWISEGWAAWRSRRLRDFARRTAVLAAAGLLAVGSNFAPLWYAAQHTPDTIRGGSELAAGEAGAHDGGLDLEYATAWSYGRAESWNLLIPDFAGRESGTTLPRDGETAAAMHEIAAALGAPGLRDAAGQLPAYWGGQPYTGGPTYLGAAALLLALVGLLLAGNRDRWWLIVVSLVMLLLSWGRNFMPLTELMFRILPGYDKFRTVSMTLVVVQWAVPLAAAWGLMKLWRGEEDRQRLRRAVAWAAGLTGGACLVMLLAGGALFDFGRAESAAMMTEQFNRIFTSNGLQQLVDRGMDVVWGEQVGDAMAADRLAMMRADAGRSLVVVLLAAGLLLLGIGRRIGRGWMVAGLAAVVAADLATVDLRFLAHDSFTSPRRRQIAQSEADRTILADRDAGFRVLNLTVSPFNDATTSYFHRSVGGYHGAKLARYQDLIDRYLNDLDEAVLDMLNTRYVILPGDDGRPQAVRRGTEYGAAWFVDRAVGCASAREEIEALAQVDLRHTAVVAERDLPAATLPAEGVLNEEAGGSAGETDGRRIALTEYRGNYLRYEYTAPQEALALFSEIYYDKGWTAYVDGAEAPALRADYVLRAMRLPAGTHTVEWRFRAPGWRWVETVTLLSSAAILAACAAVVWAAMRRRKGRTT